MQQKRSKKKVDEDREFDTTQLRANSYGYQVHRDYASHFFRWGFAGKFVNTKKKVLDVGCGQDIAFLRTIKGANPNTVPKLYVGVDLNPIKNIPNWKNCHIIPEFNFIKDHKKIINKHGKFDLITNFEVIEHMNKTNGLKLLKAIKACLASNGLLILSTPVFNGKAAANHIHEYTIDELKKHINKAGFTIEHRYGTFASYHTIKKVLTKEQRETYENLRKYYSDEVCACFLAPLYPDQARNNVWLLRSK